MKLPDPRVRHIKYKCTGCGTESSHEKLTVKRAVFTTMGQNFKTIRSRTVGWLCETCRNADNDWKRERGDAPGMANTRLHDGH